MTNETIAAQEQTSKPADGESELNAGLELELSALNKAVDDFSKAMKEKLAEKAAEGWHGWNVNGYSSIISAKLLHKANLVEYDRKQAVDVANLAMMLWHQDKSSNDGASAGLCGDLIRALK